MIYALDTSVVVDAERGDDDVKHLIDRLQLASEGELCIAAPAYSEVYLGYLRKKPRNKRTIQSKLDTMTLLNTSKESSIILAQLEHSAKQTGRNLPLMDLLIASIVMAHGATLVTKDAHFKEIPGLDVVVLG